MAAMSTAIILGAAAVAGATAYSANVQSKAAKTAASMQKEVGLKQIEASLRAPELAAEAAKAKLKAKQASATQSILTAPGGLAQMADENINQKSILGV
jgi:ribosomal protein S11